MRRSPTRSRAETSRSSSSARSREADLHKSLTEIQIAFLLLLAVAIAVGAVARRVSVPYPILLVLGGLGLGFVPGLPRVALDPDIVFFVILPPLLYAAAWTTSWRDFKYNLVSISSLAIGLVGFTVAGVALAAPVLLPGFDWRTGFLLGAVVCTTDAIAATAIMRRMGLPRRIVDVVEGESLVNDATGLLALELGLSMLGPDMMRLSFANASFRFSQLVIAGVAIGLAIGFVVNRLERRIDDGPIEIAISLLVPYVTYLLAERLRGSGVLAVVTAGLYLSRRSSTFFSPAVRIQIWSVWSALTVVLNGFVFLLIGLQLPFVLESVQGRQPLLLGLVFSLLVIALRLGWVFPGARVSYFIRRHILGQKEKFPPQRWLVVTGWAGMRGVIALAAALSLPAFVPQRELIVLLTFAVILATLVGQGLTLAPLIRWLRLAGAEGTGSEEKQARQAVIHSALHHLEQARAHSRPELKPIYDDLALHYRQRLAGLTGEPTHYNGKTIHPEYLERYRRLSLEVLQVERERALQERDQGHMDDEALRSIERELDLTEARLLEK